MERNLWLEWGGQISLLIGSYWRHVEARWHKGSQLAEQNMQKGLVTLQLTCSLFSGVGIQMLTWLNMHITHSLFHNKCCLWRVLIWLVTAMFCHSDNSMVTRWSDHPLSKCVASELYSPPMPYNSAVLNDYYWHFMIILGHGHYHAYYSIIPHEITTQCIHPIPIHKLYLASIF